MNAPTEDRNPARRLGAVLAACVVVIGAWWALHPQTREPGTTRGDEYRIDVNAADVAELRLLPGVGEALATRIVEDRDAHGPFTDLTDLQRVRGIGPSVARQAEGFVTFSHPD